jgi:tetratricopeptide (TPR) repeat protein
MVKHLHKFEEALDAARNLEREGKLELAEKAYLKLLSGNPSIFQAYDRLLVIYRKQKEYRKELAAVNQAIKAFNNHLLDNQKEWMAKHKVAARLSKSLAVSLGVMDKKGLPVNDDPLLVKWKKRKALINKKLQK